MLLKTSELTIQINPLEKDTLEWTSKCCQWIAEKKQMLWRWNSRSTPSNVDIKNATNVLPDFSRDSFFYT